MVSGSHFLSKILFVRFIDSYRNKVLPEEILDPKKLVNLYKDNKENDSLVRKRNKSESFR